MTDQVIHFNQKRNYQKIRKDKVVRLKYLLSDSDTEETLAYRDDMLYLHGGYGSAFPKVEEALEGLEVDMKAEVSLNSDEAYGDYIEDLRIQAPIEAIPEQARTVGAQLDGEAPDGSARPFQVIEITDEHIIVDGNHPLAGRNLHFHFEVLDIRDASAAEIEAGYGFSETDTHSELNS